MTAFRRRFNKQRSAPLPFQGEGKLWDKPQAGRPITRANVGQDVSDTIYDVEHSEDETPDVVFRNVRQRLGSYLSKGPDINQPVPLTPNPWKRRRKQ